jgi:hypothetical protein
MLKRAPKRNVALRVLGLYVVLAFANVLYAQQLPDEVSGITRQGELLYLVDDAIPGTAITYPAASSSSLIEFDDMSKMQFLKASNTDFVVDLEAVGFMADGRLVALSERLRQIVDLRKGVAIASLPEWMSEFGNRGLEGMAIKAIVSGSRVAVLYEGGYTEAQDAPLWLSASQSNRPMVPFIVTFDVPNHGAVGYVDKQPTDARLLNLGRVHQRFIDPELKNEKEPYAQRFRAPGLVWHEKGDSAFIVLLSSENRPVTPVSGAPCKSGERNSRRFSFKVLQRFTADGQPVGDAIDLDSLVQVQNGGLAGPCVTNWEGIGWYEPGSQLIVVNDRYPGRTAGVIVDLPESWR